jgi:hypothetical protein
VENASGKAINVDLVRDKYVLPETEPEEVKVLGETGTTLIGVDTYMSAAGELSYCQAGQERFLRIISACRA